MNGEVRIFDTPQEVAAATADLFVSEARAAIGARGVFTVSLAGGTTPKAAYALLAQAPRSAEVDWPRVRIFFGDERCVPPDDAQSNYRMARETFLDACNVPESNVFRIQGELEPQRAADAYAQTLRDELGTSATLDLVLLGMGPDGHTASLFPGTDPLTDNARMVRAVYAPSVDMWRVTLTPAVLNAGRTVAFGIEGSGKAAALAAVRARASTPTQYPAHIISPQSGRLLFLVDRDAARDLPIAN